MVFYFRYKPDSGHDFDKISPFILQADEPVWRAVASAGKFQLWIVCRDPVEQVLLVAVHVDDQQMTAAVERLFKAPKIPMGLLNAKQATFPGKKAQNNNGQNEGVIFRKQPKIILVFVFAEYREAVRWFTDGPSNS